MLSFSEFILVKSIGVKHIKINDVPFYPGEKQARILPKKVCFFLEYGFLNIQFNRWK